MRVSVFQTLRASTRGNDCPDRCPRQNSVLVAKPIEKTPEAEEQRMAIQDDFDINHLGLLVSPLGVGPSLVFKPQLFLPAYPGL